MKPSVQFPFLKNCALVRGMSAQEKASFLDKCTVQSHPEPTELLIQGEHPPGIFIIASGVVEISYISAEGHRAIITHLGAGEALGEAETIAQLPCVSGALALAQSITLLLPVQEMSALMACETFVRNVSRSYVERMLRDNQFKAIDQFETVDQRIISYLCQLSSAQSVLRINQTYLANVVGCSRQTANRVLGHLRDKGLIAVRKSEIEVLDAQALGQHRNDMP